MGASTMSSRQRRLLAIVVVASLVLPSSQTEWKWEKGVATGPEGQQETLLPSPRDLLATQENDRKVSPADSVAKEPSLAESYESHAVEVPPATGSPRFLGHLKTKLCKIGLGINKKRQFIACRKNLKHRVTRDTKTEESNEPTNRLFGNNGLDGVTANTGGLGGLFGSGLDGLNPKVTPSFGVHFGSLPNTGLGYTPFGGGGGYGYGSSNPLGLDIGPVSVNPFVGFKVTKVGAKPVFTPSLDLLVTPNAKGVHALEGLKHTIKDKLSFKKDPYPYPYPSYGGGYPYSRPYPSYGGYPSVYGSPAPVYPKPVPPPPPPPPPVYVPPRPVYTPPPRPPVYVPPKPVYSPPVYTPPKPAYSPPKPAYSPPRPAPVAPYHPPHSEVHHHEHTHYHQHDHGHHHDSGYSSGFVPSISGYGRSDSSKAPLSTSRLRASSASTLASISGRSDRGNPTKRDSTPIRSRPSSSPSSHFQSRADSGLSFKFPDV